MNDSTPATRTIVVIGGGAFGTSIAFHLATLAAASGEKIEVRVLERFDISEGTTWHSAGMVGQLRSKPQIMQLIKHSAELYDRLEAAKPGSLGFRRVGSLRLATTVGRVDEMTAQVAMAVGLGIDASMISPSEIAERVPHIDVTDLLSAAWIPSDGYTDPEQLARGLAAEAELAGAIVQTGVSVEGLLRSTDRAWTVQTSKGDIAADEVVIASGFHTPLVAELAGVFVPLLASRQQLIGSGVIDPAAQDWPTVREPDKSLVMRPRGDQWVVGSYAPDPEFDEPSEVPASPRFVFTPEADRMGPAWQAAAARFPILAKAGQADLLKGPEGVTPDGEVIAGPSGIDGLWIATGGSGHGIAAAGGIGWFMSEWIVNGAPPIDPSAFALDRFPQSYRTDPAGMRADIIRTEIGHYAVAP